MLGATTAPSGDEQLLTVTVVRDEHGYGMKVSGDNPVYVQSVKEHGAAWRAGLRAGDRILKVDTVPVHRHTHQQVVQMIRANPSTVLTVQQNAARNKTNITSPVPVNPEKQRQFEASKVQTVRLMLEQQQKYIRDLRNELSKVPDVRKQAQLETAEQKCAILQHEFDTIMAAQTGRTSSFLSGLPRSLSNLTGHSLRNLRLRQQQQQQQQQHNKSSLPTTCLDSGSPPPPLPPRSSAVTPALRRCSHSLETQLDAEHMDRVETAPNSIALQMTYPLVNAPPPPLQNDTRRNVPVLHVRSQSSPEHLDQELSRSTCGGSRPPPPGTPPPPYHRAPPPAPCTDPQRAIISMEEDDSPASDHSSDSGLFSNLRSVRESKARTAVLLNWLLAERRSSSACLFLMLTDAFRSSRAPLGTLRRWAYEIHSTFVMPHAVLQINGVDENMANEIEHVLVNEHDKEELLRNVFRKSRGKAKEQLSSQLAQFQVKRRLGLAALYSPRDSVLAACDHDPAQEAVVVERVLCGRISSMSAPAPPPSSPLHVELCAALAAALAAHCRPAAVMAAAGGVRGCFLQRDKLYKQRLKHIAKHHPNPLVNRGHHLQLTALTSVGHCHHCDHVITGLAPQAYLCTDCKLRVHLDCAKSVEESCCIDGEHHNNRISRFMERIQPNNQDSNDKKSRKSSGTSHFLNMERSFRKMDDEQHCEQTQTTPTAERRDESDESLYESADGQSDAISASDDALSLRLSKTPTMSKESLKLAITDEEVDFAKNIKHGNESLSLALPKKGHKKALSLSNPLDMVKSLGEEWFETAKRELEKKDDTKSRESLWSEEDKDAVNESTLIDRSRKNSKKENISQNSSRKSSINDGPKSRKTSKGSSVSALNFLRRKKTPTAMKTVEVVAEAVDKIISTDEILNYTRFFLEEEKRQALLSETQPLQISSDEEQPTPKSIDHRRRLSRQASRSKSKVRGKSQSLKVNTLKKSHSGTLKKNKRKGIKTPLAGRSRQASVVELTPIVLKKKTTDTMKHNSWFGGHKGESRREGSTDDAATENDNDPPDAAPKDTADKDNNWRTSTSAPSRGVNRAESCRERDAPRRGKHRNASDPNRLTAHNHHDLEPGAPTAASASSSSSSLSSRSNESNTVAAEHQASQSELSDEEEPLAAQWTDSLPPNVLDTLLLDARIRKRQEVVHELIISEGSHVRWLKVLGRFFLRPLESQPSLLPPDELKALFPNLPGVRERHAKLYTELRAVRTNASNHVVEIGPVAEAMLNTLGDSGYSSCLSRFCRGQRMALDSLRERRRKNKELHQFLTSKEQQPLCARLQLKDLLACVWQRLTKYQLLLESILKTTDEDEQTNNKDIDTLRRALAVAKQVLQTVDTSIRTAENEHRVRWIQSKLEVRAPLSSEWEELRRLELSHRTLRLEGDLTMKVDNKRTNVLALFFSDCLVLLHREGDKFVLRPSPQNSPKPALLSPLIRWDRVIFRPNAALRNTFFLMNINGVQMHELSVASTQEYTNWVKCIQEAPLISDLKPLTVSHTPTKSNDDSGINVSRNPSDASEKSDKSDKSDNADKPDNVDKSEVGEKTEPEKCTPPLVQDNDADENNSSPRHALVRGASVESTRPSLVGSEVVRVTPPVAASVATTVTSTQEQIRRLDAEIMSAMRAKSECVAELLHVPRHQQRMIEEMAVADAHSQLDEYIEPFDRIQSPEDDLANLPHLLLAAQAQMNQLLEVIQRSMSAPESSLVALTSRSRCDHCTTNNKIRMDGAPSSCSSTLSNLQKEQSYDMLSELDSRTTEEPIPDVLERAWSSVQLARRLAPLACGLQCTLGRVCAALPDPGLRARRAHVADNNHRQHAARAAANNEYQTIDEASYHDSDPTIQDEPSNGG